MAGEVPPAKPQVKTFACPNCGSSLQIKALGQTVTVGCAACGATLDTTNELVSLIDQATKATWRFHIPLGTRGRLRGIEWEMIGVMGRSDVASGFKWTEYLLYNPYQGFRWLSEGKGHWSFIVPMKETPKAPSGFSASTKPQMVAFGKKYTHFQSGIAKVEWVVGEFYWRVRKNDRAEMKDYVSPPEMISSEKNENEVLWSHGEYLAGEAVAAAFRLKSGFPMEVGVSANQPSPFRPKVAEAWSLWSKFFAAIATLWILHLVLAPNRLVDLQNISGELLAPSAPKIIGPFTLDGTNNLEVQLDAPDLKNQYIDLDVDLVNETTGETRELQLGAEYWSGYDSDGSWTEGSKDSSDLEPAVGPGTYHLSVARASANEIIPVPFSLAVRRGSPVPSNFLLALLLVSIYPIYVWLRDRAFETNRWAESDYAPNSDDDEEEEEA